MPRAHLLVIGMDTIESTKILLNVLENLAGFEMVRVKCQEYLCPEKKSLTKEPQDLHCSIFVCFLFDTLLISHGDTA